MSGALPLPAPPVRAPILEVRPPGSKSLTNRTLLLAALADGVSLVRHALVDADDGQRMINALRALGARLDVSGPDVRVEGVGGSWRPSPAGTGPRGSGLSGPNEIEIDSGNAGTVARFVAAAALRSPVPVVIDGGPRMRQRPIGELVDALTQLGARVDYLGVVGCPPIRICADRLAHASDSSVTPAAGAQDGATLTLGRTQSSQFISALLLVAPWLPHGVTLRLPAEPVSASYVDMTLGLLQRVGASVRASDDRRVIRVGPRRARDDGTLGAPGLGAFDETIEPDASGATPFWGAAALIRNAEIRVPGLGPMSLQGDAGVPAILARMGASLVSGAGSDPFLGVRGGADIRPVLEDLSRTPDAAMALAVVAAFARGPTVFRGVRTLRVKETDRIAALRAELAKIGVRVESPVAGDADAMTVTPPFAGVECAPTATPVAFDTYDDHRMAMALALVGLRRPNVTINDPACVAKTYPSFWEDWARLYA